MKKDDLISSYISFMNQSLQRYVTVIGNGSLMFRETEFEKDLRKYLPDDKEELTFGEAIEALKQGKRVSRKGWNGKGMFLYYVPAANYPAMTEIAKKEWGENGLVPYGAYIAMKTVQGVVVPWLASQTDMLSEDWCILD